MEQQIPNQKNERGIILLEAVIAVGVLVTVFTAAITLYIDSVGGIRMTNDQLIATFLAQDGMEQVIAKRQYNNDEFNDWLDGLDGCQTESCGVDYLNRGINTSLPKCDVLGGCALYVDDNGVYSHESSDGTESYFTREVSIVETTADVEALVTVTVSWLDGSTPMAFPLTYNLYNAPNFNMR